MFDPTKPVQTRDGRKARIIATDRVGSECPIVALISTNGREGIIAYSRDGRLSEIECAGDLINIPVRREGWVNVYRPDGAGERYFGAVAATEKEAINWARPCRVATAKIEWEE